MCGSQDIIEDQQVIQLEEYPCLLDLLADTAEEFGDVGEEDEVRLPVFLLQDNEVVVEDGVYGQDTYLIIEIELALYELFLSV